VYTPSHFAMPAEDVRALLDAPIAAELITATASGLRATFAPFIFDASIGEHGALLGHLARNNDQWSVPAIGDALVILRGPDAYVTPSWYASKAEHGRVVPTWNYLTAHVYGALVIHEEPAWLDRLVRALTEKHEQSLVARTGGSPWSVDDAPPAFIASQLRAIVGVELRISRIEAKSKLSQNRSGDIDGVIAGLGDAGQQDVAAAVRHARP
jgi:transcriptional regulator